MTAPKPGPQGDEGAEKAIAHLHRLVDTYAGTDAPSGKLVPLALAYISKLEAQVARLRKVAESAALHRSRFTERETYKGDLLNVWIALDDLKPGDLA